jgi:hypothetical protein
MTQALSISSEYLVDLLSLAICLWVISRTVDQMGSEGRVQLFPKVSNKLRTLVGNYHLWNSVQAYHTSYVDLHILFYSVFSIDRYEMGRFGESIHDHPNRIKLAGRHG